MKQIFKRSSGFSLLELLIVMAVFGIIVSIAVFNFSKYRTSQALLNAENETVALLGQARARTLSGDAGSVYGVHFETNKAVLFTGGTFSNGASGNVFVSFDNPITASTISLAGGGTDVVFQKLTGNTDAYGTVILGDNSSSSTTKTITINKLGSVSYN